MRETFSAGEVSRLTSVPYTTLNYWARTRFIVPSAEEAKGTGSERRYTFKDLVALRVAKELRQAGISTQALKSIIRALRREGVHDPLSEVRLLVRGNDVLAVRGSEELASVLRQPGQFVFAFILDLTRPVRELRDAADRLKVA